MTDAAKLHPRLRVMTNCDAYVAAHKSELGATVATTPGGAADETIAAGAPDFSALRDDISQRTTPAPHKRAGARKRPKLKDQPAPDRSYVNVVIELQRTPNAGSQVVEKAAADSVEALVQARVNAAKLEDRDMGAAVLARRSFISATVPVSLLPTLSAHPDVAFVHPAEPIRLDAPAAGAARAPSPRKVQREDLHRFGEGVIVGIIDVGGFDFAHPDFRDDAGGTRFLRIWDQGADGLRPSPAEQGGPAALDYGSEIRKVHMDAAIAAEAGARLPATRIEPQTQATIGSHGTHVASIAAGRSGVAPKADIAAVLIAVPQSADAFDRRRATFVDSSRIIHAIEYLLDVAKQHGDRPISINISLGTNGGSHDGANGVSRWIDALLATPGRSICVAAGNAGQEAGLTDDDLGFVMGRIHSTGRIASRGLDVDLQWTVIGDGVEDMSENELEIWYGAQDRITVLLRPPGPDADWIEAAPQRFVENRRLDSGTTVSIYNELYHPTNGANYIALYLSPDYNRDSPRGVQAGVWTVRLRGDDIRDGRFNAWIERDDPGVFRALGGGRLMRFPSFFSAKSNVDSHSVNSLGCANRVTCVANLDDRRQRINATSSQGPTRDGRCKPDIAGPGTDIGAAKGFAGKADPWIAMSGTSMASPYVCGVIALMLTNNPKLTSAQCAGILQRTAKPLPGHAYDWRNDAGFGVIDPVAALLEGAGFNTRTEVK